MHAGDLWIAYLIGAGIGAVWGLTIAIGKLLSWAGRKNDTKLFSDRPQPNSEIITDNKNILSTGEMSATPLAVYREHVYSTDRYFELYSLHIVYRGENTASGQQFHSIIQLRDLQPNFIEAGVNNPDRVAGWIRLVLGLFLFITATILTTNSPGTASHPVTYLFLALGVILIGYGAFEVFGPGKISSWRFHENSGAVLLEVGPFQTETQKIQAKVFCEKISEQIRMIMKGEER